VADRKGRIILGWHFENYEGGFLNVVMGERLEYSIENPDYVGSLEVDD
jgi:hypothetical protein